jgi:hypothetical protein
LALRVGGVVAWSSFLSAAAATMVCFAFFDPAALTEASPPAWWGTRMQVYTIGFFFFWGVGFAAAGLAWYLAHGRRNSR